MYRIEDEGGAIRALQRLLFVSESGIYDSKTRDAVIDIQKSHGKKITGVVDLELFEIIREINRKERLRLDGYIYPPNLDFPYTFGDSGSDVAIINAELYEALSGYENFYSRKPRGSFYSHDSAEAVKYLRQIYRLKDGEEIDEEFYYFLKEDIRMRK